MAIKALEQEPCEDWYDVPSDKTTHEQARQAVKDLRKKLAEYLKQEPCEDCISRQAVLAIAGDSCLDLDSYEDTKEFCDEIKELPSVTPQLKTGHWIEERNDYGEITHWHCSNCYDDSGFITTCKWDYCPKCGAKMQEVKE